MKTTKIDKLNQDRVFADGLGKHFSKSETIHVNGEPRRVSDLVTQFEDHEALVKRTAVARSEWLKLAAREGAASAELQPAVNAIGAHVRNTFGIGSEVYTDFGLKERKVGQRTALNKAQAAAKAKKTREADHPKAARPAVSPVSSEPTPPPPAATNGTPRSGA
jgi:hypothetical protein